MAVAHSTLLAALRAGKRPLWLLDLELPDSTRKWSSAGIGTEAGMYEPRVLRWGDLPHLGGDDGSGALTNLGTTLTVSDKDRTFSSLTESADADDVIGSAATIRLAAEGVSEANWFEAYRGRLAEWTWEDFAVRLTLRQEDEPLIREVPSEVWTIRRSDWPHANPEVYGLPAPLLYGSHNSAAWTNQGFVPVLRIDTRSGMIRDLICAAQAKTLNATFVAGVETGDASLDVIERNGRRWSTLTWSSDPTEGAAITCDVDGYEVTGDGTGALITDPAKQLEHFLINFVFGDYRTGDWATSHAQVDSPSFTTLATFFAARSYSVARRIAERSRADSLISEWALSQEARAFWSFPGSGASGKVSVAVEDLNETDIYSPLHHRHWIRDGKLFRFVGSDRNRVDGLTIQATYDESQGTYVNAFSVGEPKRFGGETQSLEQRWGAAS